MLKRASPTSSTLITGIAELTTNDAEFGTLHDAAVVLDGPRLAWVGPAGRAPSADRRVDVDGRAALPGWVDSHTHLVFAGDRAAEFTARMAGQPYAAGGIATTVAATRAASDDALRFTVRRLVNEAVNHGTTCIETKTGYGLTVADELRSALVAGAAASSRSSVPTSPTSYTVDEVTFLGAHVVPSEMDADEYVALVCGPMLDAVTPHVRWVDVFCERGAFDADQSRAVLVAGAARGLGLRVHGNQLGPGPGVRLAVELGAASVDHCNYLEPSDVDALASTSDTVATLLPACDLSTRGPLPDARTLLDAGATVALASNCNPGSSYTTSMAFCVATAVLQLRMSVTEAVRAATLGGAMALRRTDVGVLRPGVRADLHVLDAPASAYLAYRPGVPLSYAVWRAGVRVR